MVGSNKVANRIEERKRKIIHCFDGSYDYQQFFYYDDK